MTTVNEIPRVHQWLRTVLRADATLLAAATGGVHRGRVPEGKSFPAVVFSFLSATEDVNGNGPARVWSKSRYIVKAVSQTDDELSLQTIADRIDAVLQAAAGGKDDVAIDFCMRRKPVFYQESGVANKVYTHLGGEYEIAARYEG